MSLTLAAALLASTAILPSCSWDKPGHNPFMGDVVSAVDRYIDIPKEIRDSLKRKMAKRQYDDIATINRDTIVGSKTGATYADLREMHFGPGSICKTITRTKWAPTATERGLVYCERDHCIIVPTVCRNVSRVTMKKNDEPLVFETAAGPPKEETKQPPIPMEPLDFETAAGIPNTPPQQSAPQSVFNGFPSSSFPSFSNTPPMALITPSIPEPKTWIMMTFGVGILLTFKRKRDTIYHT